MSPPPPIYCNCKLGSSYHIYGENCRVLHDYLIKKKMDTFPKTREEIIISLCKLKMKTTGWSFEKTVKWFYSFMDRQYDQMEYHRRKAVKVSWDRSYRALTKPKP